MLQEFLSHAPWLQIIVAGVAYFAIGAIWYAPPVFGKYWAETHKIVMTEDSKKKMPMLFGGTFLFGLMMAVGMGIALHVMQAPGTCVNGIKTGLFVSGAFVAMPMAINYMYQQKPIKLWIIDVGYHVIGLTLMGIIISIWH